MQFCTNLEMVLIKKERKKFMLYYNLVVVILHAQWYQTQILSLKLQMIYTG